jgi:hypothetical protein
MRGAISPLPILPHDLVFILAQAQLCLYLIPQGTGCCHFRTVASDFVADSKYNPLKRVGYCIITYME